MTKDAVPMNTTSQKDEATPRPWVHEIDGDCHVITSTIGTDVAWIEGIFNLADEKKNAANAAFIVKACNAHDELVEALIGLLDDKDTTYGVRVERARAALIKAQS